MLPNVPQLAVQLLNIVSQKVQGTGMATAALGLAELDGAATNAAAKTSAMMKRKTSRCG